jgi:hypothetical protein
MAILDTINIDSTMVLRLIESQLSAVSGITIEYLGMPALESGVSARLIRVKSFGLNYDNRNQNGGDHDEAALSMELEAMVTPDAMGGGLANLSAIMTAVKVAFDRQYMEETNENHQVRTQVTGTQIIDTSQPGSDNSDHGALIGTISITGTVTRTSTLTVIPPS